MVSIFKELGYTNIKIGNCEFQFLDKSINTSKPNGACLVPSILYHENKDVKVGSIWYSLSFHFLKSGFGFRVYMH